jgi:hypothetical protein
MKSEMFCARGLREPNQVESVRKSAIGYTLAFAKPIVERSTDAAGAISSSA